MERFLRLVLGTWFGVLCTICCVVAPSLFAIIPDRQIAGQVAGHFFNLATWLGIALGVAALLLMKLGATAARTDYFLIATAILTPVLSEIVLRPVMGTARATGNMQLFGILHGVSALLFVIACVATLAAFWRSIGKRSVAA